MFRVGLRPPYKSFLYVSKWAKTQPTAKIQNKICNFSKRTLIIYIYIYNGSVFLLFFEKNKSCCLLRLWHVDKQFIFIFYLIYKAQTHLVGAIYYEENTTW